MGVENKFLKNNIEAIHRRKTLDVMIYTFVEAQKSIIPGISVDESVKLFLKHFKIDEGELSSASCKSTYFRIQKEIIDDQKTCKKQ